MQFSAFFANAIYFIFLIFFIYERHVSRYKFRNNHPNKSCKNYTEMVLSTAFKIIDL